jgi:hypothetical protein
MPSTPRWFAVACGLLALNLSLIVASSVWRHASADEPQTKSDSHKDTSEPGTSSEADTVVAPTDAPDASSSSAASPLNALPIPNDLPSVPPPADPQALANDPVFLELRKVLAEGNQGFATDPPAMNALPETIRSETPATHDAIKALERQLKTAELLCVAARRIAQDASQLAADGDLQSARNLMQTANQLREISTGVLVGDR